MRETEVSVAFQSPEKTVYVLRGTKLLEAAALADLVLNSSCGGEGLCGKCRVVVAAGAGQPTPAEEKQFFSAAELHSGCRLACRCTVDGPMSVVVPQPSLLGARGQILVHSEGTVAAEVDPVVRKRYVELPLPARGDDDADLLRLEKAVGPLEIDLDLLRGPAAASARVGLSRHRGPGRRPAPGLRARQHRVERLCRGGRRRHHHAGRRLARRQFGPRPGRGRPAESPDPLRRRRRLPHPPHADRFRRPAAIAGGHHRGRRRDDRRALPSGRRAARANL